jgi:endonuclease/exonuclease/phosphatase family metal-dependent hydrolase
VVPLGLLAACAYPIPQPVPTRPAILTVITWNMHGGRGDLRRLVGDLEAGRLTGSTPRDYLLLLQEFVDRDDAVRSTSRALTLFASPVRGASSNAIVSTIALSETRTIDLPRERQPRAAVAATVRVDSESLFVVSTHLENRLGWLRGLFGDRARGRQAAVLLRELPGGHGVVGGDFNTMLGPDEPAWRAMAKRFPDTPEQPEPTFRDRLVLDHLFFDLPDGWRVTRRVIDDQYGSDHHPVLADVHWR